MGYEHVRKKSKFLGWIWAVGDLGYYQILLTPFVWLGMSVWRYIRGAVTLKRFGLIAGIGLLVCVFWFLVSIKLRGWAERKAEAKP